MRFAAALSAADELDPLYEAGCDEVYLGLLEDSWRRLYGGHDIISRRQGKANLSSREELETVLERARILNIPVYLALNARYTPEQYPYLLDLCSWYAGRGGSGVILQDMGLLLALKDKEIPLRLTASLLMMTVHADGVRFLKQLGISRVVLPRFLTLEEMKAIAAAEPDMEYEIMGMGDQCPMIDGLCRSYHGETYESVFEEMPGSGGEPFLWFPTFDTTCEAHHLCEGIPRKLHPCAACELRALNKAGIRIIKFGGRGTPLSLRVRDLEFFSLARNQTEKALIRKKYQETYGHECQCYYS